MIRYGECNLIIIIMDAYYVFMYLLFLVMWQWNMHRKKGSDASGIFLDWYAQYNDFLSLSFPLLHPPKVPRDFYF